MTLTKHLLTSSVLGLLWVVVTMATALSLLSAAATLSPGVKQWIFCHFYSSPHTKPRDYIMSSQGYVHDITPWGKYMYNVYHMANQYEAHMSMEIITSRLQNCERSTGSSPLSEKNLSSFKRCPLVRGSIKYIHNTFCEDLCPPQRGCPLYRVSFKRQSSVLPSLPVDAVVPVLGGVSSVPCGDITAEDVTAGDCSSCWRHNG